jgi:hypothetical protein
MECHFCDAIHIVGPYVLVVFFSLFIYKLIKRHQEHIAQLHGRTLDVFERQAAVYERVHYDLVAIKKNDVKDVAVSESDSSPKKR